MKKIFYLTVIIIANSSISFSQPPPPGPISGCWPPPCVPIDGGISFLLAAGIAYGGKKLYNQRKNNEQ